MRINWHAHHGHLFIIHHHVLVVHCITWKKEKYLQYSLQHKYNLEAYNNLFWDEYQRCEGPFTLSVSVNRCHLMLTVKWVWNRILHHGDAWLTLGVNSIIGTNGDQTWITDGWRLSVTGFMFPVPKRGFIFMSTNYMTHKIWLNKLCGISIHNNMSVLDFYLLGKVLLHLSLPFCRSSTTNFLGVRTTTASVKCIKTRHYEDCTCKRGEREFRIKWIMTFNGLKCVPSSLPKMPSVGLKQKDYR